MEYEEISNIKEDQYTVRGLKAYTVYLFYIIAINNIGRGPPSAPVEVRMNYVNWNTELRSSGTKRDTKISTVLTFNSSRVGVVCRLSPNVNMGLFPNTLS